jgi:hypothetical protein
MTFLRRFSIAPLVILSLLVALLPGTASGSTKPGVIMITYETCGGGEMPGTAISPVHVYLKKGSRTIADRIVKKAFTPYRFVAEPGRYRIESKGITTLDVALRSGKVLKENVFCTGSVG